MDPGGFWRWQALAFSKALMSTVNRVKQAALT